MGVLLLSMVQGRARGESADARKVRAASRQAFALIETLHTVMEIDAQAIPIQVNGVAKKNFGSGKSSIEFWVTREFVRYRTVTTRDTSETVVANGVRRSLTRLNKGSDAYGNIFANDLGSIDALWVNSGLATKYASRFLFDLLDDQKTVKSLKISSQPGRLTQVTMGFDNGVTLDVWQSDTHNGLNIKQRISRAGGGSESSIELESIELKEIAPGIWFTERAEERVYLGGQLAGKSAITFRDTAVNKPITVNGNLDMPPGIRVNDHINRNTYTTDSRGNAEPGSLSPFGDRSPTRVAVPPEFEDDRKPTRWPYWVAIGFLIAVIAAAPWVARRVRRVST